MTIKKVASSGTLESSDLYVLIEPSQNGIELDLQSSVKNQFEKHIRATISDVLMRLDVKNAKIMIVDKGALDCTIKARLENAIFRACEEDSPIQWGGIIV